MSSFFDLVLESVNSDNHALFRHGYLADYFNGLYFSRKFGLQCTDKRATQPLPC